MKPPGARPLTQVKLTRSESQGLLGTGASPSPTRGLVATARPRERPPPVPREGEIFAFQPSLPREHQGVGLDALQPPAT